MINKHQLLLLENTVKNIFVIIIGALFYRSLARNVVLIDADQLGNFLLVISIFLVTVCFANFAFTYEKVRPELLWSRLLAHLASFTFMLLAALLLETLVVAVGTIYPALLLLTFGFSAVLYLGLVLYDFWDLFRLNFPRERKGWAVLGFLRRKRK